MPTTARHILSGLLITSCLIILLVIHLRSSWTKVKVAVDYYPTGMESENLPKGQGMTVSTYKETAIPNKKACQDKEKNRVFALIKVPKTGSSTLYTIFMRFALAHRLNVLLPTKGSYINIKEQKGTTWDIGPDNEKKADTIFNHAMYNEKAFQRYMKPNFKMIFSVREQVPWFKSAVKFFYNMNFTQEKSAEKVIMEKKWTQNRGLFHLLQLKYLGFNYVNHRDLVDIKEYISHAVPKIDIPVLNDKFDASLVMLKHRFCWDYIDIFYQMNTVTNSSSMELSEKAVESLLSAEFNKGDQLLYKAVEELWWEQPEVKEKDFWDEVSYFTSLNKRVATEWCSIVSREQQPYVIHSTQFHDEIQLTVEFCRRLKMDKTELCDCVHNYVFGTRVPENVIC